MWSCYFGHLKYGPQPVKPPLLQSYYLYNIYCFVLIFVQINFENIKDERFKTNFERADSSLTLGTQYDGKSVMHYRRNAFSIDSNKDTIVSKVCIGLYFAIEN